VIPPLDSATGLLPLGRHVVTVSEVEAAFVTAPSFTASATRTQIWNDFVAALDLLRRKKARIPAAFLGGSFTTSDLDPADIDTSVLVDGSRITSDATWNGIVSVAAGTKAAGLKVDLFLIAWYPSGDQASIPPAYFNQRGMWDDWWQRHVPKSARTPPLREHAMPVRGYLEVIIDGYK
jgi:uncharacterized protein DUF6932